MDEMDHAQALAEADRAGALARRSHAIICVACGNEIAPADRGEAPYCRACEPAREAA
jgi:RNA polymerase-binding transcription factor DksA